MARALLTNKLLFRNKSKASQTFIKKLFLYYLFSMVSLILEVSILRLKCMHINNLKINYRTVSELNISTWCKNNVAISSFYTNI